MLRLTQSTRGAVAAAFAVAPMLLSGCNVNQELLSPQQPQVIQPSAVANATAADALYVGALGRWKNAMNGNGNNTEALWNWEALFTDELRSADTFSQRNDDDQRNEQTNDGVLTPIYQNAAQARGRAQDAIAAIIAYDTSAAGHQHIGEMFYMEGYIEMEMSEAFCNGVPFGSTKNGNPVYTQPLMNSDGFKLAIAHFDTAATYLTATDAGTVNILDAVLTSRGRAQVDLGDFAGAATTVGPVPTGFQYTFDYSITTFDNEWWIMGPSVKRYSAGDSVDVGGQILNAIPFARLNDPRVGITDTKTKAEDNISDFVMVNNWGRDDPIPVESGIDARLIEAEAKLNAGDLAGMTNILNTLRGAKQTIGAWVVPAFATTLAVPADKPTAVQLFFREKALWQYERGMRLGDLRRLVRQYGLTQDKVYPSGVFARNQVPSGNYGTQVALPVPDTERSNPNFHGCIDTNA